MKLRGLWPAIIYQIILILMNNLKNHTDYSKFLLGSVISQKGKPIAFYSRNIIESQKGIQ